MSFASDIYWFITTQQTLSRLHEVINSKIDCDKDSLIFAKKMQEKIIKDITNRLKKVATIHMQNKILNKMIIERL